MNSMKRLILIDAHALIHRAYHALPPLTTPTGDPINAVYGFTTILLRILKELKPDYIVAAYDLPGPTFRHIAYDRYKAHRPETPTDLGSQFARTEEILKSFGIPIYKKEGYEADDIIATIAKKLENKKGLEIIVVTGDLDALQLVGKNLKVYTMKKGVSETIIYDEKAVEDRYGLKPSSLLDFKGLKGDVSDNIPGVKGIGEKTAAELIKKFGTIEGVYTALKKGTKKISESTASKLREGVDDAKSSKELARMDIKVPLEFKLGELLCEYGVRTEEIKKVFEKFGFFSLIKRIESKEAAATLSKNSVEFKAPERWKEIEIPTSKDGLGLLLFGDELYVVIKGQDEVLKFSPDVLKEKDTKDFFEKNSFFAHDGKSVLKFLRAQGIEIGVIAFDTMLAAYLTSSLARNFSYEAVVSRELGRVASDDPLREITHFFEIAETLKTKIHEADLGKIFRDIELPLLRVLADMEERGIKIDTGFLAKLSGEVKKAISLITKEIYKLAGEEFNINSPRQLSVILFEKLGIKTAGLRKTAKGGVISTRESELDKLRSTHPVVGKILEYRELAKLLGTYIDALPKLVDRQARLHTTFNQTGTVTGRLSSSDPNLQNIPIMSDMGREIRKAFVAERGYLLASFDYSQIELRVAAHMADDQKMTEAFKKGLDIHRMTAAEIYNIPLEQVTPVERRAAKTLNFGVLYGMGPQSFAEATGFSKTDARNFIEEYFRDFSGIAGYISRTKHLAEEQGYVETILGRRRYIPEILSGNWQLKREAERMAVNAPIQGSAADLVKAAMIEVANWIKKEKLEDSIKMLLQVHDELLFEIKENQMKKVIPQIKKIMENIAKLSVPLVVDVKAGKSWGEQELIIYN